MPYSCTHQIIIFTKNQRFISIMGGICDRCMNGELKEQNQRFKEQIRSLDNDKKRKERENNKLKTENKRLETENDELKKKIPEKEVKERVKETPRKKEDVELIDTLKKRQADLVAQLARQKQQKVNTFEAQNNQLKADIVALKRQIQTLRNKIQSYQDQNKTLKQKITLQERNVKQNQRLRGQLGNAQLTELKRKKEEHERKIAQQSSIIKQKDMMLKQKESLLKQKQIMITQLELSQKALISQFEQKQDQNMRKQQQIAQYTQKLQKKDDQLFRMRASRKRVDQQIHANITNTQQNDMTLFHHKLLQNFPQHKQFLTKTIESRLKKKIIRTQLVYKLDLLNKVNFHKYIDNLPNLIVIIKLPTQFIAGFTEDGFVPKNHPSRDGLLINITFEKVYFLANANRKAITYDEFYLIFGNSEIRIKAHQDKIFSNFGINSSYYNARGDKVADFLGQNTRDLGPIDYEIHQIFFQQ